MTHQEDFAALCQADSWRNQPEQKEPKQTRTPTSLNEELVQDCFFEAIISTEQIFGDLAKHKRFDLADVYLERLETLLENVQLVIDDARPA